MLGDWSTGAKAMVNGRRASRTTSRARRTGSSAITGASATCCATGSGASMAVCARVGWTGMSPRSDISAASIRWYACWRVQPQRSRRGQVGDGRVITSWQRSAPRRTYLRGALHCVTLTRPGERRSRGASRSRPGSASRTLGRPRYGAVRAASRSPHTWTCRRASADRRAGRTAPRRTSRAASLGGLRFVHLRVGKMLHVDPQRFLYQPLAAAGRPPARLARFAGLLGLR